MQTTDSHHGSRLAGLAVDKVPAAARTLTMQQEHTAIGSFLDVLHETLKVETTSLSLVVPDTSSNKTQTVNSVAVTYIPMGMPHTACSHAALHLTGYSRSGVTSQLHTTA